VNFVGYLYYG